MMTLDSDHQPSAKESVESDVGSKSEQDRTTSTVPTRVGRNTVEIDVDALRHLVGTVKAKLKP
jgi:hypothetical protein